MTSSLPERPASDSGVGPTHLQEVTNTASAKSCASPRGCTAIRKYLSALDGSPGVYRMLDERGEVLYVGKARNLKNRVSSYASLAGHSPRISRMISATASMMFLTTNTETEALLLEQNLIKQLKPRFNVLLRDDKSFASVVLTTTHPFPQIRKHRGRKSGKDTYYGPFASAVAVNRTLTQLQKVFLLRNCSDSMFSARTRPCLQFQIARCSAPCVGHVTRKQYAKQVNDAKKFLSGRSQAVQRSLARQMSRASASLEFEKAAALRDRIHALTQLQSSQSVNPRGVPEADVISLFREGDQACVQVFFIRANQNWGNRAYFPRMGSGAGETEAIEAFIGQFYDNKTPPRLLILSHPVENWDLVENALTDRLGKRVRLVVPRRGEKLELVANATRNAREALARRLAENSAQRRLFKRLTDTLKLETIPERIEVYDNSHIQGRHAVGAMIAAGTEGFRKSDYRKFNIKTDSMAPGDDFAMMREVLTRRFKRLVAEDPDRDRGVWPDLVIIDGGAGHVSTAVEVADSVGLHDLRILGVAKGPDRDAGREELFWPGTPPFVLQRNDPVLYLIQRLRDEAHRFAIGAHRRKRATAMSANSLDEVPGVGAVRKRALLAHFGSSKAVTRAGLKDLMMVEGISDAVARRIHDFFHDKS